jgi:FkbM family methyltransferase
LKARHDAITWGEFEQACVAFSKKDTPQIDKDRPIYIFGAGRFGRDLADAFIKTGYKILGFIETSPKIAVCIGLTVYSLRELPKSSTQPQIAIGVYNRDMPLNDLVGIVEAAGYSDVLLPWDCYEILSSELGWRYWLSNRAYLLNNLLNLKRTYEMLSDDVSKSCLLQLSLFRMGLNTGYGNYRHLDAQYFNEITLPPLRGIEEVTYVDCGAYNGDTYLELSKILQLGESYLFEPDPSNYKELVVAIRSSHLVPTLLPLAVSNEYKILLFNSGGEGASVSEDGTVRIAAVSLDEILNNKEIHFVKFDVEGGEIDAITGASSLLTKNRPVLAISLYHRPEDLWKIPDLLQKLCTNYSFYIRQHFYNSFDSVMYAIPN